MSSYIVADTVNVRLVPDLSAAAFKAKQTKELSLWHCLRALNYSGTGYVGLETALEGLAEVFGYSCRTIFRTLRAGEGQFWTRKATKRGTTIKLEGLKSVCVMFDTCLFNTIRFYEVPVRAFQTLQDRRHALWSSVHKPKGIKSNPISRDSLEDYTGVSRRTQQLYDRSSEVKRTPCYRPGHEQPRLPNIYHNKSQPGHRGMLIRVRRFMKSFRTDKALESRRYFSSISQMIKTKGRVDVSWILTRNHERLIPGRLEWKQVVTMGVR